MRWRGGLDGLRVLSIARGWTVRIGRTVRAGRTVGIGRTVRTIARGRSMRTARLARAVLFILLVGQPVRGEMRGWPGRWCASGVGQRPMPWCVRTTMNFRFAARQLPDRQDAFDVTRKIFMTALRGLPGFDEARASFRTWLYRIAANKVIDWCRSARPVEVSLDELALDVADVRDEFAALHEDAERAELSERAELLLRTCAPQAQRVVRLRVYADRTFPEIARVVQEPEPAVKARYYRTMRALRGQLERERVTCEHAERKHSERARPASDRSRCERAPCEEGLR